MVPRAAGAHSAVAMQAIQARRSRGGGGVQVSLYSTARCKQRHPPPQDEIGLPVELFVSFSPVPVRIGSRLRLLHSAPIHCGRHTHRRPRRRTRHSGYSQKVEVDAGGTVVGNGESERESTRVRAWP